MTVATRLADEFTANRIYAERSEEQGAACGRGPLLALLTSITMTRTTGAIPYRQVRHWRKIARADRSSVRQSLLELPAGRVRDRRSLAFERRP
jgi:hypothetical protein